MAKRYHVTLSRDTLQAHFGSMGRSRPCIITRLEFRSGLVTSSDLVRIGNGTNRFWHFPGPPRGKIPEAFSAILCTY